MLRIVLALALTAAPLAAAPLTAQAGDRMYQSENPRMSEFNGHAMWMLAARCAAFDDVSPQYSDPAHHDFWAAFGVARIRRDRPDAPAEALYAAQVQRERTEHLRRARNPARSQAYKDRCRLYRLQVEGVLRLMERGWPD